MNKNIKLIIVGLTVVLGLASVTVLGTKVYEQEGTSVSQHVIERIESNKGSVAIDSFLDKPERVAFLDSDLIEIEGVHNEYGPGIYQLDMNLMTVNQVSESIANLDPETYNVITKSPFGLLLGMKDGRPGLYHQSIDGSLKKISGNFIADETPDLKLSSNGEKLIYLVKDSAQMATYSMKTKKRKVVSAELSSYVLEQFETSVSLSPDGGYFMIYDDQGGYSSHTINVYGADSGNKYADEIQGTLPKWSPTGERLAFVYSGQLSEDAANLKNARVGYIKFPQREIVYFDKLDESYSVGRELFWNNEGQKLSYFRKDNTNNNLDLRTYDVQTSDLYSFTVETQTSEEPTALAYGPEYIAIYWSDEQAVQMYDSQGVPITQKERIDTISSFNTSVYPFIVSEEALIFYSEGQLIVQGQSTREVLYLEGVMYSAFLPDAKWIVTGAEGDDGFVINLVSRKEP